MKLTVNVGNTMLCLDGTVITVFRNGKFVKRVEYESRWEARKVFLAVSKQGEFYGFEHSCSFIRWCSAMSIISRGNFNLGGIL